MSPILQKYPVDLTGKNPNNLVIGEPHTLVSNGRDGLRVFVPQQGSFYTESLVVRNSSGTPLVPDVDYIATYLYEDATLRTGLEVCGVVVVKNQTVDDAITIDYQCVGGDYAQSTDALEQVLQTLASDTRPVEWANIVGKPTVFPAGGHLHALWELYGFEYVITQLERIAQAVLTGDQGVFDEIRDYILRKYEEGKDYTDQTDQRLQDHKANYTNPHQVTKLQVGLGEVSNFPLATDAELENGTAVNRYSNVKGIVYAINYHAGNLINQHINDKTNPHNVTKSQVGLGNVSNFATASNTEAAGRTRSDLFVTPSGLGQALTEHSTSGEHDTRYVQKDAPVNTSLKVSGGRLYAYIDGVWQTIYPAQWA